MKRIYFEMMVAFVILMWTVSNILLIGKEDNFFILLPIILSFCIQFIGILVVAATPED